MYFHQLPHPSPSESSATGKVQGPSCGLCWLHAACWRGRQHAPAATQGHSATPACLPSATSNKKHGCCRADGVPCFFLLKTVHCRLDGERRRSRGDDRCIVRWSRGHQPRRCAALGYGLIGPRTRTRTRTQQRERQGARRRQVPRTRGCILEELDHKRWPDREGPWAGAHRPAPERLPASAEAALAPISGDAKRAQPQPMAARRRRQRGTHALVLHRLPSQSLSDLCVGRWKKGGRRSPWQLRCACAAPAGRWQ
jgi:hypothetical protein